MSNSLWPHGLYSPWNSPGQNTGVGSRSLLQGIFPTQGSNPGLLHCGQILYKLCYQRSPKALGSKWWQPSSLHSSDTPWVALKAWKFFQLLPTILISPSFVHLYFPLFQYLLLSNVGFINAHLSQAGAHLQGSHQTDDYQDDIQPNSQRMPGKGFQGWA